MLRDSASKLGKGREPALVSEAGGGSAGRGGLSAAEGFACGVSLTGSGAGAAGAGLRRLFSAMAAFGAALRATVFFLAGAGEEGCAGATGLAGPRARRDDF